MGGNVVRGEGIMSNDSLTVDNIDLRGVLDGIIKLTVQLTDSLDQLVATTTTEYLKDTVFPKSYYLQTNLQDYGVSNLDTLVLEVELEQIDVGGKYGLVFSEYDKPITTAGVIHKTVNISKSNSESGTIVYEGLINDKQISIDNIDWTGLPDGLIISSLVIADPNENIGEPVISYFYKSINTIQALGNAIDYSKLIAAPTNINLSIVDITENQPEGSLVGILTSEDLTTGEKHTYTFISGEGDIDNANFIISEDSLFTNTLIDFETTSSYSVRVQTDDGNEGRYNKSITIAVTDINEAPTEIYLTNNNIDENLSQGTEIGILSAVDADINSTHSFTLVAGEGDIDNSSFSISHDTLLSNEEFEFETKNSYVIRILADDGDGGTFSKSFSVKVNSTLGINHLENQCKIYPNPASDKIYLEFIDSKVRKIRISDLKGRMMLTMILVNKNELIDVSRFHSGIYILSIYDGEKILTSRIVIE